MRLARTLFVVLLLCLAVSAVAAQEATPEATPDMMMDEPFNPNPLMLMGPEPVVFVRFAHASPDASAVDLYLPEVSDAAFITDLSFGEVTDFVFLPSNTYTVDVRAAGSDADSEVLATMNWEFPQDSSWLVAVAGQAVNLSLQVEPINLLREDIASDIARMRVVNMIADGAVVSLTSDAGDDFGTSLGWNGIADPEVAAGSYNLSLLGEDGATLLENQSFELEGGALTTLLLLGSPTGMPELQIVPFTSPTYTSRVQFVNDTDQALQFFVRPGDTELVASLAPGETSDFVSVPSGAVTFVAYAPGTGPTGQELAAWIGTAQPFRDQVITFMADMTADEADPVFSPFLTEEAAG